MPHRRIVVVIGDGQMAAQCAKLIAEHDAFVLPVVVHHRSGRQWSAQIPKFSRDYGISHLTVGNVNDDNAVGAINDLHPDILFSVNNWDIIHADLLAIPADGIVNFHNGPLPEYRGVNAPSWAIINGELDYGVTWHFVTESIDAGDIVAAKSLQLSPDETAISLILRCMDTGVELFAPLLDRYAAGLLQGTPQSGNTRYYSASDSPNGGYLDFRLPFDRLSALVRGLSFRPFENLFTYPKIRAPNRTILVSEISRAGDRSRNESWTCGEVRGLDDNGVTICAEDAQVRLSGLMDENLMDLGNALAIESCGLTIGSVLNDGSDSQGPVGT
jgi:polyketide synthase 12